MLPKKSQWFRKNGKTDLIQKRQSELKNFSSYIIKSINFTSKVVLNCVIQTNVKFRCQECITTLRRSSEEDEFGDEENSRTLERCQTT